MTRLPPAATHTYTLFPYTALFRSSGEESRQRGAEGAGAFDTDRRHVALIAHPSQQLLIAVVVRRELAMAEEAPLLVDRCCVVGVLVGVDATGDAHGRWLEDRMGCHAGIRSSVRAVLTAERTGRAGDRSVTGLLVQAPIRSVPPGRCAPRHCTGAGRQIERRTPWSYLGRGQTGPVQRRDQIGRAHV